MARAVTIRNSMVIIIFKLSGELTTMSIETAKVGAVPLSASTRVTLLLSMSFAALFLLYMVGFSHSNTIHDAAHDARHSATFPCH